MANSPHPVLFRALAPEFEARGWEVFVTTRDHGQTRDLTHRVWADAAVVGEESPGSRLGKARAIARRVAGLRSRPEVHGADIAVSLNSYAQVLAARTLRIPSVTLMDYEYQPANHLSFRLARLIAVPTVFPAARLRRYGGREPRVERFDGFKEELYLDSSGDADSSEALWEVGDRTRVVLRPPAEGALYHPGANAAFDAFVGTVASRNDLQTVVLPRLAHQRDRYSAIRGVRVLEQTVDGLGLLRSADVFVGAGGTMSREAALLGVRAYTLFAGRRAAVDAELIRTGRLHELRSMDPGAVDWSRRGAKDVALGALERRERAVLLRQWFADVIARAARPESFANPHDATTG